jgi:hypothetical protein
MQFGLGGLLKTILLSGCACAAALAVTNVHATNRITNAQPAELISLTNAVRIGQQKSASNRVSAQFEAFDRRFDLQLQVNSKWSAAQSASSALALYKGTLADQNGSWVRLGVNGADVHGFIWDGHDLFAIEPANDVSTSLVTPVEGSAHNVIFRIGDTLLDPGATSCSVEDAAAKADYGALVHELKSQLRQERAPGATLKLEIGVLGDSAFLARYASKQEARDAVLLRLNNIDGIYSSQLGVELQAPTVMIDDAASDHLSTEANPSTLLAELANLRRNTAELRSRGLTHLFTGRDLQGTTVGIAYVDALCDQKYGVGLTQASDSGAWIDSLVAAHEIGHNFGAPHDGESGKACASTPGGVYLMSPAVSGNEAFSPCSLDLIRPKVQAATCITALAPANVAIPASLGETRHAVDAPFEWQLSVVNQGGMTATGVHAQLSLPAAVTFTSASVADGTCTSGAGTIDCDLGNIAGGATRTVTLALQSDTAGSYSISAAVSAQNDSSVLDNAGTGSIAIASGNDVSIAIVVPSSVSMHDVFALTFDVANTSTRDAADITVAIPTASAFAISQVNLAGGSCVQSGATVTCSLSQLAAGANASGVLTLQANQTGTFALQAQVSGNYVDDQPGNDRAEAAVTVSASPTAAVTNSTAASSGGKSGGGGGSMSLLLIGLMAFRRSQRRVP